MENIVVVATTGEETDQITYTAISENKEILFGRFYYGIVDPDGSGEDSVELCVRMCTRADYQHGHFQRYEDKGEYVQVVSYREFYGNNRELLQDEVICNSIKSVYPHSHIVNIYNI